MTAYMDKAELRTLLEQLETLAEEAPHLQIHRPNELLLTPIQAFTELETMSRPDGPVAPALDGGSIVTRLNPSFPWEGPDQQVEFETDQQSLNRLVDFIRKLIASTMMARPASSDPDY